MKRISFIVLISLLLLTSGCTKTTKYTELKEQCGMLAGSVMHSIPDEDICRQRCSVTCESYKLELKEVNFTTYKDKCNICGCYCEA